LEAEQVNNPACNFEPTEEENIEIGSRLEVDPFVPYLNVEAAPEQDAASYFNPVRPECAI
jgi:hypothetical protein